MFKELNYKGTVNSEIKTDDMEYVKLSSLIGYNIRIYGFIIHDKSKYGKSLSVVTRNKLVNMPSWAIETFEKFGEEEIEEIKKGNMVINVKGMMNTKNGETVDFEYDDYVDDYHCIDSVPNDLNE